jgi:hypothetical protein
MNLYPLRYFHYKCPVKIKIIFPLLHLHTISQATSPAQNPLKKLNRVPLTTCTTILKTLPDSARRQKLGIVDSSSNENIR